MNQPKLPFDKEPEAPTAISSDVETLRTELWERHLLERALGNTLDEYEGLLTSYREAEQAGKPYPPEQEDRMYKIVAALLDLQHVNNERNPQE